MLSIIYLIQKAYTFYRGSSYIPYMVVYSNFAKLFNQSCQSQLSECLSHFPCAKTITWCSTRMKITWLAEHRRSENTICTAPVRDCERSEIPKGYLFIQHPRYDIHGRHKYRHVIVINKLKFRTIVLHCDHSVTDRRVARTCY